MSMKKKNKIYFSAVKLFEKGEIDKAIKKCDEGISENLKNRALLNLKGLLLYLKGDLQGAVTTWKINSDYNDDATAKNYIHDAKKDKERLITYKKGEESLRKVHIDEAIGYFKECRESDFNCIKASIALAICYIKKGDYSSASVHTTKALEIDRNNKEAIELAKQLKEYADIKLEINKDKHWIKTVVIGIAVVIAICGGIVTFKNISNKSNDSKPNKVVEKNNNKEDNIESNKVNDEEEIGENITEDTLVNIEEINEAIINRNYDKVYELISNINNDNLSQKEKAIIYKGKELLSSDEGNKYFYEKALDKYRAEDYEGAKIDFNILCTYGEESYLYQHGIYFMALCNNKIGNASEAIDYFEEYYNEFSDGIYREEVIYSLVLLYKDEDLYECKKYANELRNEYPNSMYNNQEISNLLK